MDSFIRRPTPLIIALAATVALGAPLAAAAQNEPNGNASGGDGTGVARIRLIEGSVAIQRGDSSDSIAAVPNAPVLGGDYVTSGDASRAEIELDGNSQVRLGQDVQMRFTHLDTSDRSIQIAAGTLDLRLTRGPYNPNTIDTPSITLKPQRGGSYRVTVTPDGRTLVTVRSGDAQIDTPQGQQDLQPGTTLIAQGAAASPTIQLENAVAFDDFDRFNADRDRAYAPALSDAYVNSDIGGVADLSSNGRWVTDGSYGHVWVPASVGPDWAPYRDGRWVWEEGYGWTWIADEQWGWAPYHYGSWYNSPNYGWCWYPPQPHVYVPWRPALVAFIGFGAGSGFALGFGGGNGFSNIGWVPLAPFEPYHPWWQNRYGYGYGGSPVVNNITNITNITNVTNVNVYRNVRYNAVSSVSSQRFLQGNFTRNVAVSARALELRKAQVFRGAIPVVPTASNLRYTSSAAAPRIAVRAALMQRSFAGNAVIVRRTPFAAQRVSLANTTHAAITPLHFRDAQTTPLVQSRANGRTTAQAVPRFDAPARTATGRFPTVPAKLPPLGNRTIEPHTAPQSPRTDAAAIRPPTTAGPTNAWTRFNQTRTPNNPSASKTPVERIHRAASSPAATTAHGLQPHPPPLSTSRSDNNRPVISGQQNAAIRTQAPRLPVSGSNPAPVRQGLGRPPLPAAPYHAPVHSEFTHPPIPADTYNAPSRIQRPNDPQAGKTISPQSTTHGIEPRVNPESHRAGDRRNAPPAPAPRPPVPVTHPAPPARIVPAPKNDPLHENHEPPRRAAARP